MKMEPSEVGLVLQYKATQRAAQPSVGARGGLRARRGLSPNHCGSLVSGLQPPEL